MSIETRRLVAHSTPFARRLARGVPLLALPMLVGTACAPWSEPYFVAEGTLWIESDAQTADARPGLPNPWIELIRSYQVLDEVVVREGLVRDDATPQEAARELSLRLVTATDRSGRFLRVALEGSDPERVVSIVDAVMERQVEVATALKSARLEETLAILEVQLDEVEHDLEAAELELAELRGTPEEARAVRRLRATDALHAQIAERTESVRLEVRSTIPDVRILDRAAVFRKQPEPTTPPLAILLALFGGLVGSTVLALRADRRSGASTPWRRSGDLTSVAAIVVGGVLAVVVTFFLG